MRIQRLYDEGVATETDLFAKSVGPSQIDIAYRITGPASAPPVLLIMGLGGQLTQWPDSFCATLASRGLRVIRFDNRDAGKSTHMTAAPPPDLPRAMAGDHSTVSYTLSDMAADAVGLLDAVGIPAAHVVGASMGGAIAQTMAIEHPTRVLSLVSLMSSTGSRTVGQPAPEALREIYGGGGGPPATTREAVVDQMLRVSRIVGSQGLGRDEQEIAERAGQAFDRAGGRDVLAMTRQAVATVASGDRTEKLRALRLPALVIHGSADRMCDPSGGRATAEAIPGAELWLIDGMGHDFPPALRIPLATRIADFVLASAS